MKVIHHNGELVENPYKTNVSSSFLEMGECDSNKITPEALAPLILLFVPDSFCTSGSIATSAQRQKKWTDRNTVAD